MTFRGDHDGTIHLTLDIFFYKEKLVDLVEKNFTCRVADPGKVTAYIMM
jgi:hypothetical protein